MREGANAQALCGAELDQEIVRAGWAAARPHRAGEAPIRHEACFAAHDLSVQVKSGLVYEGIFHAANYAAEDPPEARGVILKYARVIKDPSVSADKDALAEKPAKVKRIPASELVMMVARDVRMNPDDLAAPPDDFETDAAISRGRGG